MSRHYRGSGEGGDKNGVGILEFLSWEVILFAQDDGGNGDSHELKHVASIVANASRGCVLSQSFHPVSRICTRKAIA